MVIIKLFKFLGVFDLNRILMVEPSYKQHVAVSVRLKYFLEALEKSDLDVDVYSYDLGSKVSRLFKYLFPSVPRDLREKFKDMNVAFASSPPPLLAIVVSLLGKKYVVDIRDIWEEYAQEVYPRFLVKRIVSKYFNALKNADSVVVTTDGMANYYKEKLGIESVVIPNGTDIKIIRCDSDVLRNPNLMVVLADFSTPYQNLAPILEALTLVKDIRLLIIGSGKYLNRYLSFAKKLGVIDKIETAGHVPYNKLSKYLCRASIGIVGRPLSFNPEYLYTIPTKVYDYLAAGLPILAYGPPNSELQKFMEKNNIGIYLDDADLSEVAESIITLLSKATNMRGHLLNIASRYDRKKLSTVLVDIITGL